VVGRHNHKSVLIVSGILFVLEDGSSFYVKIGEEAVLGEDL
jgi:hypothetical protein